MKACLNWLIGSLVAVLAPAIATAQADYHPAAYTESGPAISGNVPMNEINAHAYRHFQKLFPVGASNEYWFASADRYSLQYYPGKEIPRLAGDLIVARYPGYRIDVVTEITDGEKTFYLVKIVNPLSIKTLSVSDGKIDLLEELTNARPETPLISLRSYP
jgi:hypothetical protein